MNGAQDGVFAILGHLDTALVGALEHCFKSRAIRVRFAHSEGEFARLAAAPGGLVAVLGGSQDAERDGLVWAARLRRSTPIVLVDPCSSKERALRALRLGLKGYVEWPAEIASICDSVLQSYSAGAPPLASRVTRSSPIVTQSPEMRRSIDFAVRVGASQCTALITGETGTGKELFADLIHESGARAGRPLVKINCAALPEHLVEAELFGYERGAYTGAVKSFPGRFVLADSGTLFLDEIGELTPPLQAKLLRALEAREVCPLGGIRSRPIDIRTLAATNQALERLVAEKRFRPDLFFRLNCAVIQVPPLRRRLEDVLLLFGHFLRIIAAEWHRPVPDIDPPVVQALLSHDWPGNVRELRNVAEYALLRSDGLRFTQADLPESLSAPGPGRDSERVRLLMALAETRWNKSEAAERLNCSRMTLYRRMHKHGIDLRREGDGDPCPLPDSRFGE